MGCHTWFKRPLTENEFNKMKSCALEDIELFVGEGSGIYDKVLYESLIRSYKENVPCIAGKYYWWELGYGAFTAFKGESVSCHNGRLYMIVSEYHDLFRVYHYPRWEVHSRHELRKKMGKKYFNLSTEQLCRVSKFFKENKDGIITFG